MKIMFEDELPEDMPQEDYDKWFDMSWVDGVRVGPEWPPENKTTQAEYQTCPKCNTKFTKFGNIVVVINNSVPEDVLRIIDSRGNVNDIKILDLMLGKKERT